MKTKEIIKKLFFPNITVSLLLISVSVPLLIYSLINFDSESAVAVISYVLSFYTLSVWCLKLPSLGKRLKCFKNTNRYLRIWQENTRLRINVSLLCSLSWNTAYAVFQFSLGIRHRSFWFCSLAGYYFLLAVMRLSLIRYTRKYDACELMREELKKYRICGIVFLIMNVALAVMIFFMVYLDRSVRHSEITTITMAAYTFTSFTLAIIKVIRYRKYQSPVYSASKAIGVESASVSLMTLESTMLTTFANDGMTPVLRKAMLGTTGTLVMLFIIIMAVYMIKSSTQRLKNMN